MALTETIPTPISNLPYHQLNGYILVYCEDKETVSSNYSGGVYPYYYYANGFYSSYIPPPIYNWKDNRYGIHSPTIVGSEVEVDDKKSIIKMYKETSEIEPGL